MATRRKDVLPSFNAVGAGQTATVDLPTDRRYHQIYLQYKGNANQATIEADITEIRIKCGGKVQRRFTAAQLNAINALNGYAFTAGMIPIFFSEPWRRNVVSEDSLAWGMQDVSTFQIEVDIAGTATAPTLQGVAVTDAEQQPLKNIVKWRQVTVPISSTGVFTLSTLPKLKGEGYLRLHCFENTAGDISSVEIEVDGFTVQDLTDAQNSAILANRDFSPQSNVFHIIFDETQRVEDGLAMNKADGSLVNEFRIDFEMAAANAFTLLQEVIGDRD
jgi:hypothetical protein